MRTLAAHLAALWVRTLRPRFEDASPLPPSGILVLWHADMLPCLRAFAGRGLCVLVSQSADGDIGARAAERLGYRVLRGSSSRGGAEALRRLRRKLASDGGWVALVADGPRGPRETCKPGAVWLSQTCGLPVLGVRAFSPHGVTLGGWARVRIPLPWTRVILRLSGPIHPASPEDIDAMMKNLA